MNALTAMSRAEPGPGAVKAVSVIKCDYVWRRTDQWINFPWSSEDPVVQRAGQVLDA